MSDISITNLIPNSYKTQNIKNSFAGNTFRVETKNDSVEVSKNDKSEKRMSKWQKLLIVGAAVATVAAIVVSKGKTKPIKINIPAPKPKLPNNTGVPNVVTTTVRDTFVPLKYKKAKTMDGAKAYAQMKLGIKDFEAPDLETANQINYSLTKLHNKTKGAYGGFRNVKYQRIVDADGVNTTTCARTRSFYDNNIYQGSDLIINQCWFEAAEKNISKYLASLGQSGQIKTMPDGVQQIELLTKYRYQDSLNRYYRLHQQGKLTPKAKVDFAEMLYYAKEEENMMISNRQPLVDYVRNEFGQDMSRLSDSAFDVEARNVLKKIRRRKGRALGRVNYNQVNGFSDLDGVILHEGGHCVHDQKMHLRTILIELRDKQMTNADKAIAREVSLYATTNYNEFVQEVFAGLCSGDKYSKKVMNLYEKLGGIIPAGAKI